MASCWAVLNLHKSDDWRQFEPERCFYPLTNGVPVITQDFPDDPLISVYRTCVSVAPDEDLVGYIAGLYRDQDAFAKSAKRQLIQFSKTNPLPAVSRALSAYLSDYESQKP